MVVLKYLGFLGAFALPLVAAPLVALAQTAPAPATAFAPESGPGRILHLQVNAPGPRIEAARRVIAEQGIDTRQLVHWRTIEAHGLQTLRFARVASGLGVPGRGVIVRFRGDVVDLLVNDYGSEGGVVGEVHPASRFRSVATRAMGIVQPRILEELLVAFDTGTALHAAWRFEVQGAVSERAYVYVDAERGTLLSLQPLVLHGRGNVFDPNPTLAGDETTEVDIRHLTSNRFLTGRYVRAQSCRPSGVSECVPEQRAMGEGEGDFLYEPEDPAYDDEFSEVNIYFHTDRVAEYFRDVHGLEWTCCEESSIIDVLANYVETPGRPYENAFYSPSSCSRGQCALMAFGQGEKDFGYDGDIVYHEYGHAIVDVTASLAPFQIDDYGLGYEPGALNEGIADYFSATIGDDPALADYFGGGDSLLGGEGALRNSDNDLVCGDDFFGEVHGDGRIWAGTLWSIREAIGAEKADALAYATLVATPSTATFADSAEILLATAESLESFEPADLEAVQAEVDRRQLEDCARRVNVEVGRTYRHYSGNNQITGALGGNVVPMSYALAIPQEATRVVMSVRKLTAAGTYDVHVRTGQPVRFRGAGSRPLISDDAFLGATTLRFDSFSEYRLPRCDTMHFAMIASDLTTRGQSVYEVTFSMETTDDPDPCPAPPVDAGTPPAEEDAGTVSADAGSAAEDAGTTMEPASDDGCGCSAPGVPGETPAWPLVVLGFVTLLGGRRVARGRRQP